MIALAVAAGSDGPHAIAEFAASLNHGQRWQLRCRPRPGLPGNATSRAHLPPLAQKIDVEQLKGVLVGWMAREDPRRAEVLHLDGKVVKNAAPAPAALNGPGTARGDPGRIAEAQSRQGPDTGQLRHRPAATGGPVAVPANTNEEAAVAAHWSSMDRRPGCVSRPMPPTPPRPTRGNSPRATGRLPPDTQGQSTQGAFAKAQSLLGALFPLRPAPSKRARAG
ncbi:MAG: hypothetical protein H7A45_15700 [Verrucomicrobiales bacterium]|nr:hypothetical protein [Verrucomicrobiales bacterium]